MANAFHAAGGKFAVAYTDPNYYLLTPTVKNTGIYPESAFGHGLNGVRTQRPQGGGTEYYLLPNSAASQAGYLGIARNIAAGGGFNYIYADGVSDSLAISLYRMSPSPVEITTTTQYIAGMKQMMATSPLPMIINGYNNGDPTNEEREYIGASKVAALFGEECFTNASSLPLKTQKWTSMANALLATTAAGYFAICGGHGVLADNRALRTYYLASWWLTYDPVHSVSLEVYSSPGGSSIIYLFAEQLIVPTAPLQTAGTSITTLQVAGGMYVRQFGTCYYQRRWWGACAAFVNATSSATLSMPALAAKYHHSLGLDNNNLYLGGVATLSTSVPTSLAPGTAAILFQ